MRASPSTIARVLVPVAAVLAAGPALAQLVHHSPFAPHPFAVGSSEGAVGHQSALGAWMIAQESRFYLALTAAVRASRTGSGALWLVGLSFLYGVFHAAGPGHGKAVISSYMVSNEVALRRGLAVALLAALFQGLVAMLLVATAVFVFHATALRMTAASRWIELAGYAGIVALGLLLTGRKGAALLRAVRGWRRERDWRKDRGGLWARMSPSGARTPVALAFAAPDGREAARPMLRQGGSFRGAAGSASAAEGRQPGRFRADGGGTVRADGAEAPQSVQGSPSPPGSQSAQGLHGAGCDCRHMPDPAALGDGRLDVKAAALAVVTAGARPCSGAVLVLVFAASQGLFAAGVAATAAMALGTALTTGALAFAAVAAKGLAMRLAGDAASPRAAVAGRLVEFAAALAVLGFGAALLWAWIAGAAGMT